MDFEKEKLEEQLQRIKASDGFVRSNVNVSLLNFLFNSTLQNQRLKEATIGAEIFGKKYDPIKNDTKVRVYIHNLRKKLAEYYAGVGANDPIIFEIEKGQYQVSFRVKEKGDSQAKKKRLFLVIAAFVALLTCAVIFFASENKTKNLWTAIADTKHPVSVIIGDHFTIESSLPTGGQGIFRDFAINSKQDYVEHMQKHPEQVENMIPNRYPYITKMGVYGTKQISHFLTKAAVDFDVKLMSEWDKTKINAEDIVYLGQFKTMGILKDFFHEKCPHFRIGPSRVEVLDEQQKVMKSYPSRAIDPMVDYTLVSHLKGFEGNNILLFASEHDVGVIHLVDYFTEPDSLDAFYTRYQISERGFTALFKVTGWERTGTKMEVVSVEKQK